MKLKYPLAAIALSLLSAQSVAGFAPYPATPSGSTAKNDTQFYAGLNWNLGGSKIPEAVVGVRLARINSAGYVYGSDFSGSMNLSKFGMSKIKAKYVDGTNNGQGEIGLGYSFGPGKFLGTLGYSLPYLNAGTDYVLGNGFEPYAGINTIDRYSKPALTYSCTGAQPATLVGTTCQ